MRGQNLCCDESIEFSVAHRPLQTVVATDRDMTRDLPLYNLLLRLWMGVGRTIYICECCRCILAYGRWRSSWSWVGGCFRWQLVGWVP